MKIFKSNNLLSVLYVQFINIIIILTYLLILFNFVDSVQINSIPSTKIYLNLDDAVVTAMRMR